MAPAGPPSSSLSRRLTFDRLLAAILFLAIFSMALREIRDSDSWWHLAAGRWMLAQGEIPLHDPFSHTRLGERWIDHGWLAQLVFYLLFAAGGYAGPILLVAALVALAFYLVWRQTPEANRWLRAFTLILGAITSAGIWAVRPQLVSFALTAVVAYLLYCFKAGRRGVIWWLLPITVLWANVHGGFAIAFILVGAYAAGETANHLLGHEDRLAWRDIGLLVGVALLAWLLVPLNPNGARLWAYPFQTVSLGVLQDFIQEWRSPDFHQIHFQPFILLLMAAVLALGLSGRRADATDLLLLCLSAGMTLLAARNIALFALLAPPVVVRYGQSALEAWRSRRPPGWAPRPAPDEAVMTPGRAGLHWTLVALALMLALLRVRAAAGLQANEAAQAADQPVGALAHLRQARPAGLLFNNYNWGGYLIWAAPDYPVFVDGRTDLYGDALLRDYLSATFGGDGWRALLEAHDVNLVLIEPGTGLAGRLAAEPGWQLAYQDRLSVVYQRARPVAAE
ncbi:MAG: hypothetical protein ACRDHL_04870 [Candidatus Promineifilaceae bacterium]